MKAEADKIQQDLFTLEGTDEEKITRRNQIILRLNDIYTESSDIKNAYADIFENTAEMKARNKTIEWWVLHLSYGDLDGTGYKPLFGDGNHEDKLVKYDDIEESYDPFLSECIKKLSYLISFWFAARVKLSKNEFDSMDRLYSESISEYKVEEDKVDVKVEEKG